VGLNNNYTNLAGKNDYPIIKVLQSRNEILWSNPKHTPHSEMNKDMTDLKKEIMEASERLQRFAPYIKKAFPETFKEDGNIESPLVQITDFKSELEVRYQVQIEGELLLKCDNLLPISGSIKARGGIYEVLKHAEDLAIQHKLLNLKDDYSILSEQMYKKLFSQYSIAVGSTGNLGLSIGIIGSKLGFNVTVHMSQDAKQWKKDLLRSLGVSVIEYDSDYSKAVEEGRKLAAKNPLCYFIDDESSKNLFIGYAVAAYRIEKQLENLGVTVNENYPLFVYLPCGVGGGPGGITYGLKSIFGNNVHCFFVEPTESPCVLLGMATGLKDQISVQDIGMSNQTAADGLAVGKASSYVIDNIEELLSGVFTVKDETLFTLLKDIWRVENIFLEPSAVAGAIGPIHLLKTDGGKEYIQKFQLNEKMNKVTHIIWSTGGNMVPLDVREKYLK
jgi:D-serine dehydratase